MRSGLGRWLPNRQTSQSGFYEADDVRFQGIFFFSVVRDLQLEVITTRSDIPHDEQIGYWKVLRLAEGNEGRRLACARPKAREEYRMPLVLCLDGWQLMQR